MLQAKRQLCHVRSRLRPRLVRASQQVCATAESVPEDCSLHHVDILVVCCVHRSDVPFAPSDGASVEGPLKSTKFYEQLS